MVGGDLAYQPAWNAGYIWDDDLYVTQNPLLTAADGLSRIWFSFDAPSQYFPLTYTTFRIEHALWGFNSAGYHWINILLHAANALLLWRLLRMLEVPAAWFGGGALRLASGAGRIGRVDHGAQELLMGFFFLLSLLAWVRFVDERKRSAGSGGWRSLSSRTLLALSAKTTACTLPAALVLILWWNGSRSRRSAGCRSRRSCSRASPRASSRFCGRRSHPGYRPDFLPLGLIERVLMGSRAIWFYLSKLAWPAELMFSYPRWDLSASIPDYVWLVLLVAAGRRRSFMRGAGSVADRKWRSHFIVATLSPLLGPVMVTTFLYSFVADHYQYLACIGPLALFAAASARFVRPSVAP